MTTPGPVASTLPRGLDVLMALRRAPAPMTVQPFAGRYGGIPFTEKGYGFDGANCWGLVTLVYQHERGIALPRHEEEYDAKLLGKDATREDLAQIAALMARHREADWREIAFQEARVFDLLELPIAGEPCHIAMYVGDLHILHVEEGIESMCEDLREPRWHSRLRRARLFTYAGARP